MVIPRDIHSQSIPSGLPRRQMADEAEERKGLFTRVILCLAIDILEYVFNRRERRGQTTAES